MTIVDYLVGLILVSSVIIGIARGLVKEVLALASWVIAFIAANAYSAKLAVLLPPVIPGEVVRLIVAFIALFIGVRLLMGLVSLAIGAMVGATGLSLVDRLLGSLFGLGRGIVIVLAAFIVCGMTSLPEQPAWKYAKVRPAVEATAKAVKPMLPEALARHVRV